MVPFHQYQRYKMAEIFINSIRKNGQKFRILEVGANSHKNLQLFLPEDEIFYLDIELPQELLTDPSYYLGDATNLDFPDKSFDIVIALDVLEHVESSKRGDFLNNIYRVSEKFIFVSAPFLNSHNQLAEERVAAYYKALYNEEIIWHKEHLENGLPVLSDILEKLSEFTFTKPFVFNHGDVFIWEKMIKMEFSTRLHPNTLNYWEKINKFYNEIIFENDFCETSVRAFIILPKEEPELMYDEFEGIYKKTKRNNANDQLIRLASLEYNFYQLLQFLKSDTKRTKIFAAQLFIDNGNGFSESNSVSKQFTIRELPHISVFEFSIEQNKNSNMITRLRFDPITTGCIIKIHSIILHNDSEPPKHVQFNDHNAIFQKGNELLFATADPQLFIEFDFTSVMKIEIRVEYTHIGIDSELLQSFALNSEYNREKANSLNVVLQELRPLLETQKREIAQLEKKVQYDKTSLETKENKITSQQEIITSYEKELEIIKKDAEWKNQEIKSLEFNYNEIINSRSWKITSLLRKFNRKK